MIQVAENKVVVIVETKYISNFSKIMKLSAIQDNSSVHLEDLVNITGTVVSIPRTISNDRTHKGYTTNDIKVGDRCIFSFHIIYDFYQRVHMGEPVYKNLITYQGVEYWTADITKIFAVIRDNKVIMINGYVMATPFIEDKIFLSPANKKVKKTKSSEVMHIGNPKENIPRLSAKTGDTIYYNPQIAQKYQINNKPFIILQQHQVYGREV